MSNQTLEYKIKLVDEFSKQYEKIFSQLGKDVEQLKKDIGSAKFNMMDEQNLQKQLTMFGKFKRSISRQAKELGEEIRKPLTFTDAIHKGAQIGIPGVLLKKAINQASTIEYGMANIKKVMPNANEAIMKQIKTDIDHITRSIPKPKAQIIEAYQIAVQSMPVAEVKEFLPLVERLMVAFDMDPGQTSRAMSILKDNFKLTNQELTKMGDQISFTHHHMGKALVPDIIAVTSGLSGISTSAKIAPEAVIALSSTLLNLGEDSSRTQNTLKNFFTNLNLIDQLAPRYQKGLQKAGFSVKGFKELMQTDATGAIFKFLEVGSKSPEAAAIAFKIIGRDYQDVLSRLIQNNATAKHSYEELAHSTKYAGEGVKAYSAVFDTYQTKTQLFDNAVKEVGETFATTLLPSLQFTAGAAADVLNVISDVMKQFPKLTQTLAIVTTATLAFSAAILGLRVLNTIGFATALAPMIPALAGLASSLAIIAGTIAAIGLTAYGIKKAYDSFRGDDGVKQTFLPSIKKEINDQTMSVFGIKTPQISIPSDNLLDRIPKSSRNPLDSYLESTQASPQFAPLATPSAFKFEPQQPFGMQQQKGQLEITVKDDRILVKQQQAQNMNMKVTQESVSNPWGDFGGPAFSPAG